MQLYLDQRCPELRNGKKVAQDLAHLLPLIEPAYLDEVAGVAAQYVKDNPALARGTLDNVRAALHHQSLQAADRYAHLYPERMKAILMATGKKVGHRRKRRIAGSKAK